MYSPGQSAHHGDYPVKGPTEATVVLDKRATTKAEDKAEEEASSDDEVLDSEDEEEGEHTETKLLPTTSCSHCK